MRPGVSFRFDVAPRRDWACRAGPRHPGRLFAGAPFFLKSARAARSSIPTACRQKRSPASVMLRLRDVLLMSRTRRHLELLEPMARCLRGTGREWKCIHPLRNDFGSIAVITAVLLQFQRPDVIQLPLLLGLSGVCGRWSSSVWIAPLPALLISVFHSHARSFRKFVARGMGGDRQIRKECPEYVDCKPSYVAQKTQPFSDGARSLGKSPPCPAALEHMLSPVPRRGSALRPNSFWSRAAIG
jgi:hypothetical protein